MIEIVENRFGVYPHFQTQGFAARFAFPFAKIVCTGKGYDIGCNRKEWKLPGAVGIDPQMTPKYDAMNLPDGEVDYIFSSHCLEHLPDWVGSLNYWNKKLHPGGTVFLYLPHPDQVYWRPWNNRKHIHSLSPWLIRAYLLESGLWDNVFVGDVDLNGSFMAMADKRSNVQPEDKRYQQLF